MIDTVKLLIPITNPELLEQLKSKLTRTRREDLGTSELKFEYYTGEVQIGSHNRNVTMYLTEKGPVGLFVEYSLPKQYLNNNVEMINAYDVPYIINNFRNELCAFLRESLPPISEWIVYRLDVCYNWTFESEEKCKSMMNLIQRIDFPRKKKSIYDTSLMYVGSAYSIKFYLKGAEFLKHDFKDMVKIDEEKAHQLLNWAKKIIRFEVGFKKGYLKKLFNKDIVYVSDISNNEIIEKILQDYLARVFKYIDKENMKNEDVRQLINANYKPAKALRLFQFCKGYYYDKDEKYQIIKCLNPSTIWRYKKDLKSIGVSFEENFGDSQFVSVKELVIPSEDGKFRLLDYKLSN